MSEYAARRAAWVRVSFATGGLEPFQAPLIQQLGFLETHLAAADKAFLAADQKDRETIAVAVVMTERITLSYLWVLGGYELVRTICQRLKENPQYATY